MVQLPIAAILENSAVTSPAFSVLSQQDKHAFPLVLGAHYLIGMTFVAFIAFLFIELPYFVKLFSPDLY